VAFPKILGELRTMGYKFEGHGRCNSCRVEIEWWLTPRAKKLPLNLMQKESDAVKPHWAASCEQSSLFR
jgi:hypothetical protein